MDKAGKHYQLDVRIPQGIKNQSNDMEKFHWLKN